MSLPPSFVQHLEQHPCFTGCYNSTSGVQACLDPSSPLTPLVVVSCADCYSHLAVAAALLPAGMDAYRLAAHVTQHLRQQRGFVLSVSGYTTKGPGFWFSAVYYACGLFLIHGERSRQLGTDLDQLLLAFKHGVLTPPDPRMTDPKLYAVQTVYGHFAAPSARISSKQELLASPQVRSQTQPGWQKLTLAEFLPLAASSPTPPAAPPPAKPTAPHVLAPGDVCPVCGAEVPPAAAAARQLRRVSVLIRRASRDLPRQGGRTKKAHLLLASRSSERPTGTDHFLRSGNRAEEEARTRGSSSRRQSRLAARNPSS